LSKVIYQHIIYRDCSGTDIQFTVKRLDMIHPTINGNKWYKLKYNIEAALKLEVPRILTFGGSHSNHIYATASAGNHYGIETVGVIRGEDGDSETLKFAREMGMHLHFISRTEYREKNEKENIGKLEKLFGPFHLVPEGGSNKEGVNGCMEILSEEDKEYDNIFVACGTGATLAGIALSASGKQTIYGVSVLRKGDFLERDVKNHIIEHLKEVSMVSNFKILTEYHCGGYAKWNQSLINLIGEMHFEFQLPLDQVYTAKMISAFLDMSTKGEIDITQKSLCIHTGGLQGRIKEAIFS